MATYKVIQDIEAEDHILGPLSLRQFIYAIICVVCLYFCYLVVSKHAAFLVILFLPPAVFTGFFAAPFGKDQPTEVWALAKIRFLFKPRRRIWDQSGVKELVTITAPKKVEEMRTDGLSQNEVHSRLNALASTIDSRGWAIKNVNLNMFAQPSLLANGVSSDRLIDPSAIPQEVPTYDIQAADDMLDPQSNHIAQQFDQLINASTQNHRDQLMSMMKQPAAPVSSAAATPQPPKDYWFLDQPATPTNLRNNEAVFANAQTIMPGTNDDQAAAVPAAEPTINEKALAAQLKHQHVNPQTSYAHMRTIQPIDAQKTASQDAAQASAPQVTPQPNPAILELASNNDLNVATLARQANKANPSDEPPEGEVVISLR